MALKDQIQAAVKTAMREKAKERLAILRLITAAIKQQEVDSRQELNESQVLATLDKMIKQRQESIKQFTAGQRDDLVAKEQAEIAVIKQFLPSALSTEEIDALIQQAINETGADSMQAMGKVMAIIKPKVQGRADMAAVSQKVKAQLTQ